MKPHSCHPAFRHCRRRCRLPCRRNLRQIPNDQRDRAKELTGSAHGFVSAIDPSTKDNVSYTLTEMMMGQYQVQGEDRRIVFPIGDDGKYPALWGQALNTREGFFSNAPGGHPASKGLPKGHVPLERFLTIPVMHGDELVGQIALANSQPYAVWYGPMLMGVLLTTLPATTLRGLRRRYEQVELNRIRAMDS